jgi:hypothetical protein
MFSLEDLEERFGLDTIVVLEHLLSPTPILLIERVRTGSPVVHHHALAGQFTRFAVLAGGFFAHPGLGSRRFEQFLLVDQLHEHSYLIVRNHLDLLDIQKIQIAYRVSNRPSNSNCL